MNKSLALCVIILLSVPAACDFQEVMPADMVSTSYSEPGGSVDRLTADVRFDIGSLEIGADHASQLYSLDLDYDKANYQPKVEFDAAGGREGRLSVQLEGKKKFGMRHERRTNRMRLNLSDSVPLVLDVRAGVGEARLSLSGLQLKRLDLESGVGGTRMSIYEPNPENCERVRLRNGVGSFEAVGLGNLNFQELDFEGGVGGADLDLTGEWKQDASMRVEVGVGGVTLRMPRDIGVRVEAEKHLLSGFHLDGFVKRDSEYYSENYDQVKIRVSIRVQTGIGGFRISWI